MNNEIVKAEDLGFNTDISNSQETTKDKEKHLNAELHTDLFNKSERNKLIEAKKKIETVVENLGNSNRFKEGIAGVELDKFKNERQKEFNLINDQNISLEDKQRIVQDLYRDFLRSKGYKGDIPEVILTDGENSFSVDSKDKETGERRKERIFISINNLNNKYFSKVFVHELAHMNTYDEGYLGEETSLYTRSKLEPDDKTKVFSEADKEKYLETLRAKYPKQKSLEEQYAEAKLVPEKDREHFVLALAPVAVVAVSDLVVKYGPVAMDLINKYGPVVYNFLLNPQNYEWAQVLIDNPELFATKDAIIKYIEEAKDKGEKLEEVRKGQKQEESSGSSQSPDPNKNKPDKDFNKVNLEETVNEITKGVIKHSYNGHSVEKIIEQLSKRPYESMAKYLKNNTFFNPNWRETEVKEAAKLIYKSALNDGFSQKYYEITYLGEKVTGYFENGIFKSLYGNYKFTYEQLVDFATKRGI